MKTLHGITFALALAAMTLVVSPKRALADNPTCDSSATYDSNDVGTEPNGSTCADPDPSGGIGD